MKLRIQQEWSL